MWVHLADFSFLSLKYSRQEVEVAIIGNNQVISTVGGCTFVSDDPAIVWKVLGVFVVIHLGLLIGTNAILWQLRDVQDRYQEQKYVLLASSYVVEVLLVGCPVIFAIRESTSGVSYLVLVMMVFFIDFGILCLIFIPKMYFQHVGLPEGVPVARTIYRSSAGPSEYTGAQPRRTSFSVIGHVSGNGSEIDGSRSTVRGEARNGGEKVDAKPSQGSPNDDTCESTMD